MPSNEISERVASFLGGYAPFDALESEILRKLAESVEIRYHRDKEKLFGEGDGPGDFCFVIRKGKVDLYQKSDGKDEMVDVCGEGDIFGVRSMLSGQNYKLSAIVDQEALIYAIPVILMRELVKNNASVSRFFAFGLASAKAVISKEDTEPVLNSLAGRFQAYADFSEIISAHAGNHKLFTAHENEKIKDVSEKMNHLGVGSVIVSGEDGKPLGIVTDTDIREKVATGKVPITDDISSIMSSPVITIRQDARTSDIVLKMMNSGVHHLCITRDGTPYSEAVGIISNHDLLINHGGNPAILHKSILRTDSLEQLKVLFFDSEKLVRDLIANDLGMEFINNVVSNIRDQIISQAIDIIKNDFIEFKGLLFNWVALGSEGRSEQILKTDIDNMIIYNYENPDESVKKSILDFAAKVNEFLFVLGFSECPAGVMAHNADMSKSYNDCKQAFRHLINTPDPISLMKATIFFDLRLIYGDNTIIKELKNYILEEIRKQPSFLNFLAKNAVENPPPLSFFNQFIVETSGEHKDEFDIKARAIMPLTDAARILAFEHEFIESTNTAERFKVISELEPTHKSLFQEARTGISYLHRIRALAGKEMNGGDGRFIDISSFNKLDRKILKEIFSVISEIQKILKVRYQLDYFRG